MLTTIFVLVKCRQEHRLIADCPDVPVIPVQCPLDSFSPAKAKCGLCIVIARDFRSRPCGVMRIETHVGWRCVVRATWEVLVDAKKKNPSRIGHRVLFLYTMSLTSWL